MKILQVGAKLLHADGRTEERVDKQIDRYDEANSRFWQFCESASEIVPDTIIDLNLHFEFI
jgi:hypothetical protein